MQYCKDCRYFEELRRDVVTALSAALTGHKEHWCKHHDRAVDKFDDPCDDAKDDPARFNG